MEIKSLKEIDNLNAKIAKNLVGRHFSLSEKSFERFEELVDSPKSVDFINNMFKDSVDNRIRFELPASELEETDKGWDLFKHIFADFFEYAVGKFDFKYIDFRDNKILVGNNTIKLKKVLEKYYLTEAEKIEIINSNFRIHDALREYYNTASCSFDTPKQKNVAIKDIKDKNIKKLITEDVKKYIIKKFEEIGVKKLPVKSKLEVVFSRNFVDYMLCSTGESWTSCLSMESHYSCCFWSGVPGLVVDPNRILIYVTDGTRKKWEGMEVDKFIQRTWAVFDDNDMFNILHWYETKKIKNKTIKNISNLPIRIRKSDFIAKEKFVPLFFENGYSCFIYQDDSGFKYDSDDDASNNLVSICSKSSSLYVVETGELYISTDEIWNFSNLETGLLRLIHDDCSLDDFSDEVKIRCDNCGEYFNENTLRYIVGSRVCRSCISEYYRLCSISGERFHIDDLVENVNIFDHVDVEYVSKTLLEMSYYKIGDVYFKKDELITINENGEVIITHPSLIDMDKYQICFYTGDYYPLDDIVLVKLPHQPKDKLFSVSKKLAERYSLVS